MSPEGRGDSLCKGAEASGGRFQYFGLIVSAGSWLDEEEGGKRPGSEAGARLPGLPHAMLKTPKGLDGDEPCKGFKYRRGTTGFAFYRVDKRQMRNRSQNDRDITVSGRSQEVRAQRSSMTRAREWSPKDPRHPGQKRG